jgi:hypothetical protein
MIYCKNFGKCHNVPPVQNKNIIKEQGAATGFGYSRIRENYSHVIERPADGDREHI